jgi:hypothetical protein
MEHQLNIHTLETTKNHLIDFLEESWKKSNNSHAKPSHP